MNDLTLNILGFAAVNRDLTVELRDPTSNKVVQEVKPYLDGTVRMPQVNPGAYEIAIRHPNLALPVLRRPIRVLPEGDTKISVLIDPAQFRNTPIEDIPEANLGPVRTTAQSVGETVLPLSHKQPGEAIKAEDWNAMASNIRDLSLAVAELTRLVSPTGHDHPEFVHKFDEMTNNFTTLLNTLTAAMAELQRQIQSQRFRVQIEDVLQQAEVDKNSPRGKEILGLVDNLEQSITASPLVYGRTAQNVGIQLQTKLEALIDEKSVEKPDLVKSAPVTTLAQGVELLKTQRTTNYGSELEHQRKVDRTGGQAGLIAIMKRG
jgi:hypothetical protein